METCFQSFIEQDFYIIQDHDITADTLEFNPEFNSVAQRTIQLISCW